MWTSIETEITIGDTDYKLTVSANVIEEISSDTGTTYSVGAYEYDITDEALVKAIDAKYNFDDELIEAAYG